MPGDPFPVLDVSAWEVLSFEELGSKPKFWLRDSAKTKWLFKHRHRPKVGDDWAEKIAAEVAEVLEIPHATVELARFGAKVGIISRDLVGPDESRSLLLGNSLLLEADPTYPQSDRYQVAEHTIDRVFAAVGADHIGLPEKSPQHEALTSPLDLFVGYLMLDALIGNTDRHHENWAVIELASEAKRRRAVLCPSFDHASSLGHSLLDTEREKRLATKDRGYSVAAYVLKARSALYRAEKDSKPMSPLDAFREAERRRPAAARYWRGRIDRLPPGILDSIVARIPVEIMNGVAKRFAQAVLDCNRINLLAGTD